MTKRNALVLTLDIRVDITFNNERRWLHGWWWRTSVWRHSPTITGRWRWRHTSLTRSNGQCCIDNVMSLLVGCI